MSIFKKKAKPIPNPIFEMGVAPDKTGKPTLADVGITVAPVSVPMTATEVRRRLGTLGSTLSTTGAGATWTTTSTTGPWTTTITPAVATDGFTDPPKEEFNVYKLTGLPEVGLYLRLEGNYYCPLADVGQPTPNIAFANVGVELVGNLLDWAMEAIDE